MYTKQVEIFKTNVSDLAEAKQIIQLLDQKFPQYQCNFDLDDCDRILRIETHDDAISPIEVQRLVTMAGYTCSSL